MNKITLLSLLSTPLALAAPFQPETIPAEANWFLHGDITALQETTTGSILIKQIRKDQANQLAEIENIFDLDLLTDLTDVTLFGTGQKDEGALIFSGDLNPRKLAKIIVNADNYKVSNYGTISVHHWDDKGKTQHAAFHGNKTVIISQQEDLVQLALDVFAKKKPGLKPGMTLPSKNPVVVAFANIKEIELPDDQGSRIIRRADSLLMTLGEEDERLIAGMTMETDSVETSHRMLQVMEGLVSLGMLADENIEALDIRHQGQTKGGTMSMTMSLSATKALALLSKLQ